MRATFSDKTELYTLLYEDGDGVETEVEGAPRFRGFYGGLGWAEPTRQDRYALNWFVVVGHAEDGSYNVIAEESGELAALVPKIIDWKDMLCVQRIWIDTSDRDGVDFLRDPVHADGLCSYRIIDRHRLTRLPVFLNDPSHWKYFRDRSTLAHLLPVVNKVRQSVRIGWERILSMNAHDDLVVLESCTETKRLLLHRGQPQEIHAHPLTKALVWVLGSLDNQKEIEAPEPVIRRRVYGNLK